MFTSNKTPIAPGLKRSRTYGKQVRPFSHGLDDFVEGQDFVFAQKNAPKHSATTAKVTTSLPTRIVPDVPPTIPSPQTHALSVENNPLDSTTTPAHPKTPSQNGRTKTLNSSTKSAKRDPQQPSIFDPPSSDDEPEHYQLVAPKMKKGPPQAAGTSSLTEFVEKKLKDENTVKSNVRPKLVKTATEAPKTAQKMVDIFDIESLEEEGEGTKKSTELKRKRPVLNRAATVTPISPPKKASGPATDAIATKSPSAKRPRLSASPSVLKVPQPSTPPRPANSPTKPSPRRTPQRTRTSPPKLMQNERSAPAVLTTMIRQPIESPVCNMPDAPIEYIESPKRRHSSASNRSATPVASALSPVRTPGTTPRQEKLWSALLQDDSPSPPHAALPSRSFGPSTMNLAQPLPRRRLVDILKSAAEPSSDITASDDMEEANEAEDEDDRHGHGQYPVQSSHATQSQNTQLRVTYASQRSFLVAPADFVEDFSQPLDDFSGLSIPNLPGMPQDRSNNVSAQTSDDEEEESSKAMQSLHELRAAGGSRRFEDEIPLGDLEGGGKAATSRRRAALMEICNKLISDSEFLRKFSQSGVACLVIQRSKLEKDVITNALIALIVALVFQGVKSSASAIEIHRTGVMNSLSRSLGVDRSLHSIAKDRASNMSKATQQAVRELQSNVCSLTMLTDQDLTLVSPKLLALKALEVLIRRLREAGNREALLNKEMLLMLSKTLLEASSNTNQLNNDIKIHHKMQQELVLSLVESFVVAEACNSDLALWDNQSLCKLVQLLEAVIVKNDCSDKIQQLVLRICISLANNNARISDAFARPDMLKGFTGIVNDSFDRIKILPLDEGLLLLDRLVLGLGALINLAEWSDEVRIVLLGQETQGLNAMIKTFTDSRASAEEADSMEMSQINVAYGYLAILLGNISQNRQVKEHVRSQLPGKTLQSLIAAIDEFVLHHQKTDQLGEGAEDGAWTAFTERLRAVADALKRDS